MGMKKGDIMDYKNLANEFMEVMAQMHGRNAQKRVSDSMNGENFVLAYIFDHESNAIPSEISHAMGTTSARIAAVLNSLEKKGMIMRRIDVEDRRRILIDLTEIGREYVNEQKQKQLNFVVKLFEYLGEYDSKEYIRIMKKISEVNPEDFM